MTEEIPENSEALQYVVQQALAKNSLYHFIKYTFSRYKNANWHHELMAQYYQALVAGDIKRLMVFAPPRHMKSESMERALAFALGADPDEKVMVCGYGVAKSRKISENVRHTLMQSTFCELFPEAENYFDHTAKTSQDYWTLGRRYRGQLLAAGVGGAITGEGFTLAAIDDPVKSRAEAESPTYQEKIFDWYEGTFLNRQDESDARIIIVNTRWNRKDLCGRILEREGMASYNGFPPDANTPEFNGEEDGAWHVLNVPALMDHHSRLSQHPDDPREEGEALWPSRFPVSFLKQFMRNRYNWASLYQGQPQPKGGNLINRKWFNKAAKLPSMYVQMVRFWDFAGTPKEASKRNDPDYTAGVLVASFEGDFYIIDVKCIRDTPGLVSNFVRKVADDDFRTYGNRLVQAWEEESGGSGKLASEHYNKLLNMYKRLPYKVYKAKEFYIDTYLANKAESGNVFYIEGYWLSDRHDSNTFFDECEEFPKGRHDDRIDACAKAIYVLAMQMAKYESPLLVNTLTDPKDEFSFI